MMMMSSSSSAAAAALEKMEMDFSLDGPDPHGGVARLGSLTISGKTIPTPALVLETQIGTPPYLTRDLLEEISPPFILVDFGDMFAWGDLTEDNANQQLTLKQKACLPAGPVTIMAQRGQMNLATFGSLGAKAVHLQTPIGRKTVSPELYAAHAKALKPDIVVALHDEIPFSKGRNRQKKATEVSKHWLETLKSGDNQGSIATWGAALASENKDLQKIGSEALRETQCSGAVLSGFGLEGCTKGGLDLSIVAEMVSQMPVGIPRMIHGNWAPVEILQFMELGIDLVGTGFGFTCSENGRALVIPTNLAGLINHRDTFFFDKQELQEIGLENQELNTEQKGNLDGIPNPGKKNGYNGSQESKSQNQTKNKKRKKNADTKTFEQYEAAGLIVNLWDSSFQSDKNPLSEQTDKPSVIVQSWHLTISVKQLEGCTCPACRDHTKSYVHHLLIAHEILAQVLLYLHNIHQLLGLFDGVRAMLRGCRGGSSVNDEREEEGDALKQGNDSSGGGNLNNNQQQPLSDFAAYKAMLLDMVTRKI